jgi:ATP-binding cassette subfamily F protein 3
MLLDEPTNHLDIYTREALEEALEKFTGALIVVSHDRYFVDRVAENIIIVEDGEAEVYAGNYSELVAKMKEGVAAPVAPPIIVKDAPKAAGAPKPAEPPPTPPKLVVDRTEQRKRDKRIKKIDEEIAQLETRIAAAEGERERNDLLLCSEEVFRDGDRVKKIQQQNHDLKAMIDLLYGKWETLSKEKEELETAVV